MDYRKLNDVTREDCFLIPWVEDTPDTLAGAKWFSVLGLKSDYWQVDLHLDNKEKTAFLMGQGLWQFTVMPFGLFNAPVTFERLMETVLRGITYKLYLVYMDDMIVIGLMFQEHLLNLRKMFQLFREACLKLSLEKSQLFQKEVWYLGHIVSPKGITTDPEKLRDVREWLTPMNKQNKELPGPFHLLQTITGFANIA